MYVVVPGKDLSRISDETQIIAAANANLADYHRERRRALTTE